MNRNCHTNYRSDDRQDPKSINEVQKNKKNAMKKKHLQFCTYGTDCFCSEYSSETG
jgi:hypothetical protein